MNIKKIIREEIDSDWDFMGDISDIDYVVGKAFYFKPPYNIEDYIKLYDFFVGLGLKPINSTPIDPGYAIGLYVENNEKFVYTRDYDDDSYDSYKYHIEEYSRKSVEVIDAKTFIEEYIN